MEAIIRTNCASRDVDWLITTCVHVRRIAPNRSRVLAWRVLDAIAKRPRFVYHAIVDITRRGYIDISTTYAAWGSVAVLSKLSLSRCIEAY